MNIIVPYEFFVWFQSNHSINERVDPWIIEMLKLPPVKALDYAAALEDAAEELHILGKLVPPHYQYTESAEEVRFILQFN